MFSAMRSIWDRFKLFRFPQTDVNQFSAKQIHSSVFKEINNILKMGSK